MASSTSLDSVTGRGREGSDGLWVFLRPCNIGPEEIGKRKQVGWIGLIITVVLLALFIIFDVAQTWRLLLFVPAVISAMGFLQARNKFCANYGLRGVFNFSHEFMNTSNIKDNISKEEDKRKAWQIIIHSVLIGLVVAIIAYYLPLTN